MRQQNRHTTLRQKCFKWFPSIALSGFVRVHERRVGVGHRAIQTFFNLSPLFFIFRVSFSLNMAILQQ